MIAHSKRISKKKETDQAEVASPSLAQVTSHDEPTVIEENCKIVKTAIFIYKCVTVSEYTVCCK